MKAFFPLFAPFILFGAFSAQADTISSRDSLISLSQTHNSNYISDNHRNDYTLFYDTESVKLSVSGASGYFGTSVRYKFDPMHDRKWFVKTGGDYTSQQFSTARFIAYSALLTTGYMVQDDLYVEAGGRVIKYDASTDIEDETVKLIGGHAIKRWESTIGTVDTSIAFDRVFQNFADKNMYSGTLNYYPMNNVRLGFGYRYAKNGHSNHISFDYGYLYSNYNNNFNSDISNLTIGIQCAFSDLTDFSSYRMPTNIKRHLSE
ncbi:MAG: hypothetical protein M0P91_10150 [Sulfuricurvum sp.]|jgi:hypothetical protein|uniref:hypothetical protein n=1 Tax=Sulfuricurvum sp. TaxID=2025608 RepID=UPI0025D78C9C|nr:hypothetical protein [Sulfuricurvum sp.]MCK9373549.1 hypothetical protein [Sulfuricurvum sp.]